VKLGELYTYCLEHLFEFGVVHIGRFGVYIYWLFD